MWLGHHFQVQKVKGQGHQAALLTAVLARQAAASVGVRNALAVGNCCYVAVCSAAEDASAPAGGGEGRGAYRGSRPPTACSTTNQRYWTDLLYGTIRL